MQKRPLGQSGIHIAPMVFGGNVFGWTADTDTSFTLLDHFVERGFNAIDTADVYSAWAPHLSGGESETVLGQWLHKRGKRDDIVLMSKVGMWEARHGLSAANIEAAIDASLARLQTDYLDVYFAHIDDQDVPLEETLAAFDRLIKAGKVRAIGASNYSAERLREALAVSEAQGLARYELMQPRYNLYDRDDYENNLAPLAAEQKLGVISFFSLASGFLTGKHEKSEDIEGNPRADFLKDYFDARGETLLKSLRAVAHDLNAKPAQVALAWLLAQPGVTAPIVSATRLTQLDEVLDAATLSLPKDALDALNPAGQP